MAYPETKMTCVKNLWTRQMYFAKAGDANEGHVHNYDHTTLLAYGSIRVHVGDKTTDYEAPKMIYVKAGISHYIEALEDGTVAYCVHALRDKDTHNIIDPDQIPLGVNTQDLGIHDRL